MSHSYAEFLAKLEEIGQQFRQAFEDAVADITSVTQLAALEDAIRRGDIEAAVRALALDASFWAPLDTAVGRAFEAGAVWQLTRLLPKSRSLAGRLQIRFDGRHHRAENWTRQNGARLVAEVADSVKEAVRVVVRDGLEAGRNPRAVALDIAGRTNRATGRREGGIVGLTSGQAEYVVNARRELEALDGAYFDRKLRDARYDKTVAKAIREGKPLAKADVDRMTARYTDRLRKHRGDVIARTEGMQALNAGRHEAVEQITERGDVPEAAVKRLWRSTPDSRTRDHHRSMNHQKVGMREPFVTPDGYRMMFPGDRSLGAPARETIQCRCDSATEIDWQMVADAAT